MKSNSQEKKGGDSAVNKSLQQLNIIYYFTNATSDWIFNGNHLLPGLVNLFYHHGAIAGIEL